jgi:hypothetical protein
MIGAVCRHFGKAVPLASSTARTLVAQDITEHPKTLTSRSGSDELYVIELCDQVLQERSLRQHRFDWLRGDPNPRGQSTRLPVDAYYPIRRLVIEYRERQHTENSRFFDKTDRLTVSGVHRGEQRRIYDRRRETEIPAHGIRLVVISYHQLVHDSRGRLRRSRIVDEMSITTLLAQYIRR